MSFWNNTKHINHKKSKFKVMSVFDEYSFFIKCEKQYYYMKHYSDFNIENIEDAYKVINNQDKFTVRIWLLEKLKENLFDREYLNRRVYFNESNGKQKIEELLIASKKIVREDKLKKLIQ